MVLDLARDARRDRDRVVIAFADALGVSLFAGEAEGRLDEVDAKLPAAGKRCCGIPDALFGLYLRYENRRIDSG